MDAPSQPHPLPLPLPLPAPWAASPSSQPRPLPLPLPLPAPWAASPSAASHGPSAERPASQGFEERVRGSQPGHAGS